MTVIACTGHRPDKLPNKETGYKLPNPTYIHVCQEIEKALKQFQPTKCISGMALGSDQYFASVCIKLGIDWIAAVPFEGQEKAWPQQSQKTYHQLLKRASEIVIVSPGGYSPEKMQIRNCWMTDKADQMIAIWDGTKGGTKNCIDYAQSIGKPIYFIDPRLDS